MSKRRKLRREIEAKALELHREQCCETFTHSHLVKLTWHVKAARIVGDESLLKQLQSRVDRVIEAQNMGLVA